MSQDTCDQNKGTTGVKQAGHTQNIQEILK